MRKPVFGVSDHVRHKPGCTPTEDSKRLEILDLESRGTVLSCSENICADHVTAKLVCVFVFAYAKILFLHAAAHLK